MLNVHPRMANRLMAEPFAYVYFEFRENSPRSRADWARLWTYESNEKRLKLGHGKIDRWFFPLIKKPSPTHFRCLDEGESVLCNAIHSVNLNIALNECQTTWKLLLHPNLLFIRVYNLVLFSFRSLLRAGKMFYYHYAATFINPNKGGKSLSCFNIDSGGPEERKRKLRVNRSF